MCMELPCARSWADVMERPGGSYHFCLCFVTDHGRDVVTFGGGLCLWSTQATTSVYCYFVIHGVLV